MSELPKFPWKALHPKDGFDPVLVDADGRYINVDRMEIRERIAACANACTGIPNNVLELFVGESNILYCNRLANEKAAQLEAQRDELLAALKELMNRGEFYSSAIELPRDLSGFDIYDKFQDLVAKCEAQS